MTQDPLGAVCGFFERWFEEFLRCSAGFAEGARNTHPSEFFGEVKAARVGEAQGVVRGVVEGFARDRHQRVAAHELPGRRVVEPRPQVLQARFGVGVLAGEAEGGGGGAGFGF